MRALPEDAEAFLAFFKGIANWSNAAALELTDRIAPDRQPEFRQQTAVVNSVVAGLEARLDRDRLAGQVAQLQERLMSVSVAPTGLEARLGEVHALLAQLAAVSKEGAKDSLEGLSEGAALPWFEHLPAYFVEHEHAPKTVANYDGTFRRFRKLTGDKPLALVTKDDVVRFRDDLVATSKPRQGRKTAAAQTQTKHLSALKSLFSWAVEKNLARENPAAGTGATKAAKKEAERFERRPLTTTELTDFFRLPLFSGCKSAHYIAVPGTYRCRDHRFWLPLVALFSGGRLNELAQMQLSDIKEIDGITYLSITTEVEEGEDTAEDAAIIKRLKTRNAKRLIPVHPELERLGFLSYVGQRRADAPKDGRLFPKCGYGQLYNQRLLPKAKAKTATTSFYSLRHCFKDMLRVIRSDETRDRLMGHSPRTVGAEYGSPLTVDEARWFFEDVRAPIDLSHLYP